MSIVLVGTTSGSITLQEPAVAGTTTINLPATSGTAVVGSSAVSAAGQIPFSTDGSTYTPTAKIVSGTAVASTSGTSIDFTGIPSWVKRITVMCNGVSTNGSGRQQLQLGTGGTPATTGYTAGYMFINTNNATVRSINSFTTGFPNFADEAADFYTGIYVLTLLTGNTWMCTGTGLITGSNTGNNSISGSITLGGVLNMVRFTTTSTPTFDAGTINILYE